MSQRDPNVLDHFLYYLSHMEELRWRKFSDTIKLLVKGSPIFYLRSLAQLGHLDYDPENLDRVVIAPAVLVETAVEDLYVLVGSRTSDFLFEIKKVVLSTGGKLDRIPEIYAPTTILLRELTESSLEAIESLGVEISLAFSAKLSSVLQSPQFDCFRAVESLHDVQLEKLSIDTLKYGKSPQISEEGLYRFLRYGRYVHVLKFGHNLREVPCEWGEWFVLRESRGLIRYDKKNRTLWVKERLTMPLLADRCATLCSGRPPQKKSGFFCYPDVPIGITDRLAKSLYQRLEVV